jgi:hypothetical protein
MLMVVARAKRTHWQAFTDNVRAELGATDLMMARTTGEVVGATFTGNVPKAAQAA